MPKEIVATDKKTKNTLKPPASWPLEALKSAPFGLMVHDPKGKIILFNKQLEKISGYSKDEIPDIQTWIAKLYPDKDYRKLVSEERKRKTPKGKLRIREAIITHKSGEKRICEFSSSLSSSKIRTVFIKDTKVLQEAEDSLRKSEERFRLLSQAAYEGILIHKDGLLLFANDQFFEIFGYEPHALLGKQVLPTLIAPESLPIIKKQIRDATPTPYEIMGVRKDGSTFPILVHAKSIEYQNTNARVAAIRDLSREREIESDLRESEELFREIAENIREAFWLFDWKNQKVEYVSPAYEIIWGRSVKDLYANYEEWGASIHPDDLAYAEESFERVVQTGGGETREYRIVRPDGEMRWVSDRAFAITDENGDVVRISGIAEDITERKRKDKRLEQQTKNLEEVNMALKVLLEQREKEKTEIKENLVASIKKLVYPYIEKLENKGLGEDAQTFVNIIKANINDLTAPLAGNLSSKYFSLTPSEIQIADLIKHGKTSKEIASMLNVSPKAVSFHRGNLRKKLGLLNKKINLRTYLQTFPEL